MSNVVVSGRPRRREVSSRQDIMFVEISTLEREAAMRVVNDWGQPRSRITHLVFCSPSRRVTTSDYHLTRLLGVGPSIQHLSYQRGCFDGSTVLRCFKDLADNNRGLYVLVVCSELTPVRSGGLRVTYREPQPRPRQRAIASAGVEDLEAKLKAAHKKSEADRILLRLKTAEADILRSELGLPRETKLETRTHTVRAENTRGPRRAALTN